MSLVLLALSSTCAAAFTPAAIAGYTLHAGVDITAANDTAFGALCQSKAFFDFPSVWTTPSAVCDLVRCPRFGLRAGAKSKAGPYCVKGWAVANTTVDSYVSATTCGYGTTAKTLSGSCNDPVAKYTHCPNGGGDTMPLASVAGNAAALAKACGADTKCCGFLARRDGTGGTTLQYGFAGNRYLGFDSYTRIPADQ